jgi:hypothetical protein
LNFGTGTLFVGFSGALRRYAILTPKAMIRHILSAPMPAVPLDVLVVTPGGAASTCLLKHISRFVTVNDCNDADGFKHMPFPPLWFGAKLKTRVIFVDRDIAQTLQSLERRGYIYEQLAKLGSVIGCILPPTFAKRALIKAISRQKRHWQTAKSADVMFVNYESLWEQADKIAAFLGIANSSFVHDFPRRDQSRKTITRSALPAATQASFVPDFAVAGSMPQPVRRAPSLERPETWPPLDATASS